MRAGVEVSCGNNNIGIYIIAVFMYCALCFHIVLSFLIPNVLSGAIMCRQLLRRRSAGKSYLGGVCNIAGDGTCRRNGRACKVYLGLYVTHSAHEITVGG